MQCRKVRNKQYHYAVDRSYGHQHDTRYTDQRAGRLATEKANDKLDTAIRK